MSCDKIFQCGILFRPSGKTSAAKTEMLQTIINEASAALTELPFEAAVDTVSLRGPFVLLKLRWRTEAGSDTDFHDRILRDIRSSTDIETVSELVMRNIGVERFAILSETAVDDNITRNEAVAGMGYDNVLSVLQTLKTCEADISLPQNIRSAVSQAGELIGKMLCLPN